MGIIGPGRKCNAGGSKSEFHSNGRLNRRTSPVTQDRGGDSTGDRTRPSGLQVQNANHYTMKPQIEELTTDDPNDVSTAFMVLLVMTPVP